MSSAVGRATSVFPFELENVRPYKGAVNPLLKSDLLELLPEITLKILLLLHDNALLQMSQVCKYYKTIADTNFEIRNKIVKIAHHYLQTTTRQCNIPTDDLKTDLTNDTLSVQVGNDLCLWKLTKSFTSTTPQLNWAMRWTSHLIIKNCQTKQLSKLFTQLHGDNRLLKLYLLNCQIDSKTEETLQSLQTFTHSLETVIAPNPANEYSIERLVTTPLDLIALNELMQQLQDESTSGEQILNKIKELQPIIQAGIVSSIWHSTLSPIESASLPSKKEVIQQKVNSFILQAPHHPAVHVAVEKNFGSVRNISF